jgi:hypothetical protein
MPTKAHTLKLSLRSLRRWLRQPRSKLPFVVTGASANTLALGPSFEYLRRIRVTNNGWVEAELATRHPCPTNSMAPR